MANPFDYAERFNPRNKPAESPISDPVVAEIRRKREEQLKLDIMLSPAPEKVALTTRIAREAGVPPALVDGNEFDYARGLNSAALANVFREYPDLGRHFANNPRAAVAAQDDHKPIGLLAGAWDTLSKAPASLWAGTASALSGARGALDALALPGRYVNYAFEYALGTWTGMAGITYSDKRRSDEGYFYFNPDDNWERDEKRLQAQRKERDAYVKSQRPAYINSTQAGVLQGIESAPTSLAAGVASVATANPYTGLAIMGGATGGAAYDQAKIAGKGNLEAATFATSQGLIEVATEKLPLGFLADAIAKKTPFGKAFLASIATDIPGEQLATVLQDLNEWAVLNPQKSFGEYLAERPDAAYQTLVASLAGTSVQHAVVKAGQNSVDASLKIVDRIAKIRSASAEARFFKEAGKAAEDSQLRKRDPQAYADLLKKQGEENGVEHVYVPAEAVREYMQSDGFDRFADPLVPFIGQVDEAAAAGADLVLPVEFALGTLPGTPAWLVLKDDLRLQSGGLSAREAMDADRELADVAEEIGAALSKQQKETQTRLDAQDKLITSVQAKLQNAGYTPYTARQQAEFIAQRVAARAARLGQEVTGNEFDGTDVVHVLPPALAEARQNDQTDLVINALRSGGDAAKQGGKSLLEFIAARGGVNDTGGDLAAMGLDRWHREKPFRKKLTRKFDPQASMGGITGAGDYGIDTVLQAAISEGYFPELEAVDKPDSQVLLDAMAAEYAGAPRYVDAPVIDHYRAAANELSQMLNERGLDPAQMSDDELRAAINKLEEAGQGGYEQSYGDGPRGRIRFDGAKATIELFQSRNLSTLLHELGHQYLEELRFDASLDAAPDQLKEDWATVQKWFKSNGHKTEADIPVEAHELWARGFERYLMEGKAPSTALQSIFETFRGWLIAIYKTVDALRSPITPEIREVFDRLIATDEEISNLAEGQFLSPLFVDAATIGMTDSEFSAFGKEVKASRSKASGTLLEKTMAVIRRRETERYRDAKKAVEAEMAEIIDASPLYKAIRNLQSTPMDLQWIRDEMGRDAVTLLPKRVPPLAKERGANPTDIAELSGFITGRQMIESIIVAESRHRQAKEAGDKRSMRGRAIQEAAQKELDRRYGDPLNDGSIEREALDALHNERQGEVFATEARYIARKTGGRHMPYQMARSWARDKVRRGTYQEHSSPTALQRHQRAIAKAGREAEKAIIAGDFEDALKFKQQQMFNSALFAEAKAAHDDVEAARKRLDKIARRQTMKSVDQDYLEQAHALLEAVDLRERTQKSIERQGKWEQWSAAREEEGYDIVVPASFEATLGQTNWSRLSVETLLGLDDAVKQIIHLGRMKQTLLDNQDRREFDAVVKEAVNGAGNLKQKPPRDLMEPGMADAVKAGVAQIDASLLKMEAVFDWLDGGNSNGVFNRVAFRPIAEAQSRENDMLQDYFGRIKDLFEAVPSEIISRWSDAVVLPFANGETGAPEKMRRSQLIAVALNTGNEGNLQRLTDGYGWNEGALLDYLNSELKAEEWQFVQGVWDAIETLWPEIEALERRINDVAPDKIEARSFNTPFGEMRGGYYPAIYDTSRSYKAEENRGRESDLFEGGYTRATTRASATKARADRVRQPILLDLGVINRHLGEVIHDITHREAVMQANRFLADARVMRAVDNALGIEIRKQFRPWVKFVANSWSMERAGNEGFGKWLGKLRANTTAVGMGLRATTMIVQLGGYSNSIEVVGEKWIAKHLKDAVRPKAYRFVLEKSGEVRNRMDTLDRDVRNQLAILSASNPLTKAGRLALEGRKFLFHGIGYMDRVVCIPTWLGAYNKGLSEGMEEADAIYAADKAVRASQGAGAPKDMAAIQRGTGKWGEALKLVTMFYSFFSGQYQRQRTLGRDVVGADSRRPRRSARIASRAFFLLILPPLLTEVMKNGLGAGDPPEDDEWWTQWTLRKILANSLGPIPLARDVFEPAWNATRGANSFNPQISPINKAMSSVVNVAKDTGKIARGEETTKATKHALELAGYSTGLVPGQVASAVQFLVDVGNDDADPESFGDWVEGLSTGKLEE